MYPKKVRRIRICLFFKGNYYSFCWIEFLEDSSFSLGFLSKAFKFTEYGSAIIHAGHFAEHEKIITHGTVNIKDAISPHITFHPPTILQSKGIVHMVAANGLVDEFELDWYPVRDTKMLFCAYTGEIVRLDKDRKKKSRYQVVSVPQQVRCLRMEIVVYPRFPKYPRPARLMNVPGTIGRIHGGCPDYVLSCFFYKNELVEPQFYFAAE